MRMAGDPMTPGPPQQPGGDFFDQMVKRRMPPKRPMGPGPRRPPMGTGARPQPDGGPSMPPTTRPMQPGPEARGGPVPGGLPPAPPIFQAPPMPAPGGPAGLPPPPVFQAGPPPATGSSADVDLGTGFDAARAQRLKTAAQRYGPGGNPSLRGGF